MAKISIDLNSGKVARSQTVIGIDLGTTNSLIASVDPDSRQAYCLGEKEGAIVPSAIAFKEQGPVVGRQALEHLTVEPERTIYSVKRLMGKSYADIAQYQDHFHYRLIDEGEDQLVKVRVGDRIYSPIELSSLVLKELRSKAEATLSQEVSKVVITVPAYFNDVQRQATRDAGKLAGLDVLRIINEPTAASLAYGIGLNQEEQKTVAVYDLGGGTFDVSILRIQNGIFEVLATHGDTFLGGDDIDQAIVRHWMASYQLPEGTATQRQRLRLLAERAKKKLSSTAHFAEDWRTSERKYTLELDRAQLNALAGPLIEKTMHSCHSAIRDASLAAGQIQEVVLVGGSVRMPLVKESVAAFFPQAHINDSVDPDQVVALGAAIEADILAGNRKDILLLDVTPLSLGIETLGGLMDVIIPRNAKIPTRVGREYSTSVDGQIRMTIGVYQGERDLVRDNRKLGEFILEGIPAMPAGLPKVEVRFMLDADGILKVSAKELRSGVEQSVSLKPQFGISDAEIEQMLRTSIVQAEKDMEERALVEAMTEARQHAYSIDKFMRDHSDLMNTAERSEMARLNRTLLDAVDAKDRARIVQHMDALNDFTRPYAERAMDQSIAKALKGKKIE